MEVSVILSILKIIRDDHPLLLSGLGGLFLTPFGSLAGLYSIYQYIDFKGLPFLPSMIAVLFFFLGILLMLSGLILNALSVMTRKQI